MKIRNILVVLLVIGSFLLPAELDAKVTRVYVAVKSPAKFKGQCPHKFEFVAKITSNSRGIVKYQWKRSDNATAPVKTLTFRKPGTQLVRTSWTLSKNFRGWRAVAILGPNRMMSNRAGFELVCIKRGTIVATRPMTQRQVATIKPGMIKPGILKVGCPDPAATEIRFSIVRSYTQFKKRIRITGIVKNIGRQPFVSGPNQASAHLYEMPLGSSSGRLVAQRAFRNLNPGATVQVFYERDWNSSSPSEGEFPPNYKLLIVYDPDIYMDANKKNDDCNQRNNKKERSGVDINSMIR
jgi:hypothetical protein